MGFFNTKSILVEQQILFYPLHRDKCVHAFPKGISLKVNAVVQLEFELAYDDIADEYVSH